MWGREKSKQSTSAAELPKQAASPQPAPAGEAGPPTDAHAEAQLVATTPSALAAWQMGLVVTASALCGGIAVVLWNRRLLTKMREVEPVRRSDQQRSLWEDDV